MTAGDHFEQWFSREFNRIMDLHHIPPDDKEAIELRLGTIQFVYRLARRLHQYDELKKKTMETWKALKNFDK